MKACTVTVLFLAALLIALPARAARQKKDPLTPKERLALSEISMDKLKTTFKEFLKALSEQDKAPSPASLKIIKRRVDRYLELPFFEADTGFQKKWLAKVDKGMQAAVDAQVKRVLSNMVHNKDSLRQHTEALDAIRTKLEHLMKHPEKVDLKRLQALRKKAFAARRAIKKKLEASGWKPPSATNPPSQPPLKRQ
jgi:ribosomal protein S20